MIIILIYYILKHKKSNLRNISKFPTKKTNEQMFYTVLCFRSEHFSYQEIILRLAETTVNLADFNFVAYLIL